MQLFTPSSESPKSEQVCLIVLMVRAYGDCLIARMVVWSEPQALLIHFDHICWQAFSVPGVLLHPPTRTTGLPCHLLMTFRVLHITASHLNLRYGQPFVGVSHQNFPNEVLAFV